jgi:glycosyltransferase involved in cell wall biosynthesis
MSTAEIQHTDVPAIEPTIESRPASRRADRLPHICHLVHGLTVGGAERLALRMGEHLPAAEFRVSYVCLDELGIWGTELQRAGRAVQLLGRQPGFDWRCARRLAALLRRERVDLIHAHQYTPFFYALAARHLRSRPPILFTEHGRWFPDFPRPKRMLFNRALLGRRDRVVGVGEAVRRALINNEGIPAARVEVIYNGVDLSPYRDPARDRAMIRQTAREGLGIPDSALLIAQVARLDDLKDHATAVRAMARLAAAIPQALLLIVGEGPERTRIERIIKELNLAQHVRLVGTRSDVADILLAADLFLLSSKSEGIPLTVIEAMAARLPVVSTDVGGVGEIVVAGETGLLTPAGDDAALAAAAIELLNDAPRRARLGEQGYRRAIDKFDESRMHRDYRALYAEMLA